MHLKGILVLIEISFVNHQCKKIAMTQNQLLVYTNENRWLNKKIIAFVLGLVVFCIGQDVKNQIIINPVLFLCKYIE